MKILAIISTSISSFPRARWWWKALRLLIVVFMTASAVFAGNPYVDEFSVPGNRLDLTSWTTEFGSPSYLGRTQLRDWVNGSNIGPALNIYVGFVGSALSAARISSSALFPLPR